jgi:proteic killer suppression protein
MVVTFNEDYLEKLYSKGETGTKKIWFQPQIVRGYQKGIKYLIQAKRKEDLYPFKSLHFEALHGDKKADFPSRQTISTELSSRWRSRTKNL